MNAFLTLLKASWKYAEGRRPAVVLYILMFICANVVLLIEPYAIGKLLNSIQEAASRENPFDEMMRYFILMILIPVGFWLFHGPARVIENNIAFYAQRKLKDHLYEIVTSLPVQWHKDHHSGQTINKIGKATRALFDFMANGYNFIEMIIKLVGSIVVLYLLLPVASIIALLVSIGALLIVFVFDKFLVRMYDELNDKEHFVAAALHDYVTNIYTVITLRLGKLTQSELWQRMTHYFPLYRRSNVVDEAKWFLTTFVISVMTVLVLAWYVWGTINAGEVILAGTFFMLYDYLQKVGSAFYTFAWKYSNTIQQYADLRTAESILHAKRRGGDKGCLPDEWKRLEINNLNFSYEDPEHHRKHLSDVSMVLERGKKVALVGRSGSGKSTIMSLIRGLHTSDHVTVMCDGKEIKHGLGCVAESVTLIPQEPEIFANTIEYNVSVDTTQSKDELLEDIDLACFTEVLERLPKGLKTDISEKGVNLSGGEKQRLALARGIFASKESDIILLDEPTSSVDSQNELKIHRNIFKRFSDRCIVSSIHRLHLLPLFDYVYVLQNGKVIQEGAPEELMEKPGQLREMWHTYLKTKEEMGEEAGG
ncbi:ABC transporter ATP-binding protein [Candidatus Peregrinibacteria bacterium]|nr:ABC transporter ATP-binding protein [Candidatus Peregrinibacteria bacterium]